MWVIIALIIGFVIGCCAMYFSMFKAIVAFPSGSYDIELDNKTIFNIRNQPLKILKGYLMFKNMDGSTTAINLMNIDRISIVQHKAKDLS